MKKSLSIILSLVMLFSVTAGMTFTAQAASVAKVKSVSVVSVTSNSVKLKWKKADKATGYQVYCSTKKSKGYKKVKTVKKAKTVTATVKKLEAGKKYYFKVRAVKGKKKGAFSKPVAAKISKENQKLQSKLLSGYLYQPWAQDIGLNECIFKADGTFVLNEYNPVTEDGKETKSWKKGSVSKGTYKIKGNVITMYQKDENSGNTYKQYVHYYPENDTFKLQIFEDEDEDMFIDLVYRKSKIKVADMNGYYKDYWKNA